MVIGAPQSCTVAEGVTHWPAQMPVSPPTVTWGGAFTVTVWVTGGTLHEFTARNCTV